MIRYADFAVKFHATSQESITAFRERLLKILADNFNAGLISVETVACYAEIPLPGERNAKLDQSVKASA